MSPFNPREKQSLGWPWHLVRKFHDFHSNHPNRGRQHDSRHPGVSFSSTRALKKMIGTNHPWCKSIKYWEKNTIAHSFVDSQFYSLPFNCEIDECLLGFNSYILDPDSGMAI